MPEETEGLRGPRRETPMVAPGAAEETGGFRGPQGDQALSLRSAKGSAASGARPSGLAEGGTRQGVALGAGTRKPKACGAGGETSRGFARWLWEGDGSPPLRRQTARLPEPRSKTKGAGAAPKARAGRRKKVKYSG